MKKIIIINLIIANIYFSANSQIPTIYAVGGKGVNVNWQTIKNNTDEDGPGFFYNDCDDGGLIAINASSILSSQGKNTYVINNLIDDDPMTSWVEGKPDYGIGEFFEIKSTDINTIYNGHQASPLIWKNNSRVKKFKIYKNNIPLCFLILTDEMGRQHFELPIERNNIDEENKSIFKFEIIDVYKGLKWSDVAISHIALTHCCFSVNTKILSDSLPVSISTISIGQSIKSIDVNSGQLTESKIVKTTKQTHLSLFKISTKSKLIELTPNHPIYIKNYGFTSINKILKIKQFKNYEDLINQIEFLTWNEKTNKLEFEKLDKIELIKGVFETYTILELKNGNSYIANGFITKIY